MNIGLQEIIIILVILGVIFGIAWAFKSKRFSKKPSGSDQATKGQS